MENAVRQEREENFGKDLGLMHELAVTGRDVGATVEFWSRLAHGRELLARVIREVTTDYVLSEGVQSAKKIISYRSTFIGPNEVKNKTGYRFSADELAALEKMPFSPEQLERCHESHLLIAVPAISLVELAEYSIGKTKVKDKVFPTMGGKVEYDFTDSDFANRKTTAGWYLLKREPLKWYRSNPRRDDLLPNEFVGTCALTIFCLYVWLYAAGGKGASCTLSQFITCSETNPLGHQIIVFPGSDGLSPEVNTSNNVNGRLIEDLIIWPFEKPD